MTTNSPAPAQCPSDAGPACPGLLGHRLVRAGLLLLGAAIAGAAALVAVLAVRDRASPFVIGFEAVSAIAGVMVVMLGLGRFARGAGLTLLCVAGAVFASAAMSWWVARGPDSAVNWNPWLAARGLAALAAAAASASVVLAINPAAQVRRLAIGVALAVPVVAVVGWLAKAGGAASLKALPVSAQSVVVLFGGVLLLAMFSASVHYVVTAFQLGLDPRTVTGGAGPGGAGGAAGPGAAAGQAQPSVTVAAGASGAASPGAGAAAAPGGGSVKV